MEDPDRKSGIDKRLKPIKIEFVIASYQNPVDFKGEITKKGCHGEPVEPRCVGHRELCINGYAWRTGLCTLWFDRLTMTPFPFENSLFINMSRVAKRGNRELCYTDMQNSRLPRRSSSQ
jgi:hypothetical protein